MCLYQRFLNQFHMPNAFDDWKEYRNCLTDYLIAETNTYPVSLSFFENMDTATLQPTLLIVGAGACNDLDLGALSNHFSHITLLDSDASALQQALSNYPLANVDSITLQCDSLNGITDSHYESFCQHLKYICDTVPTLELASIFSDYACNLISEYFSSIATYKIPISEKQYDYIWCSGVHSQLQSMFSYIYNAFEMEIHTETGIYKPDDTGKNPFHDLLRKQNNQFIPKLNDALILGAKYKCFIGLEFCRTDENYEPLSSHENTPIEGAYQGILHLSDIPQKTSNQYVFWPFSPANQQYYEVQLTTIEIN